MVTTYKITPKAAEFVSKLFTARIQFHIFHLQITGEGSFAAHKALEELYTGIVDLTDDIVESYQGKYGIIKGYKTENYIEGSKDVIIKYIEDLHSYIDKNRTTIFEDSDLLNIVDEVKSLLKGGLYKLKNLS
jgi:DNA-binding ferritin-like protein